MILRVLLIDTEPEDVLFLGDVLREIEAGRFWDTWIQVAALHASTLEAAAALLADERVDVILLDPDLGDSQGIETFRRVQAVAPQTPVVLLVGPADTSLALKMIREGAQDFLVKKDIDCAPLAHAIQSAIERHRLISAARACATMDSLTGLPNREGFLTFADRDRKLAGRLGRRLMILLAEPRNLDELTHTFGEQRRDLALVETADRLRGLAGATDLLARIAARRFGVAIFETGGESLEQARERFHEAAMAHHLAIGSAIFDPQRPESLDVLLEQASLDFLPDALAHAANR